MRSKCKAGEKVISIRAFVDENTNVNELLQKFCKEHNVRNAELKIGSEKDMESK